MSSFNYREMTVSSNHDSHIILINNVCRTTLESENFHTKVGNCLSYEYTHWCFMKESTQNTPDAHSWSAGTMGAGWWKGHYTTTRQHWEWKAKGTIHKLLRGKRIINYGKWIVWETIVMETGSKVASGVRTFEVGEKARKGQELGTSTSGSMGRYRKWQEKEFESQEIR